VLWDIRTVAAPGGSADKRDLRSGLLARRRVLTATEQAAVGQALATALAPLTAAARTVAAYASAGTEPSTGPLLAALSECTVLLPVLLEDGDLDWAAWDGRLLPGLRGTRQPAGPRLGRDAVAACEVVVVPALAVDRRGVRLGRGGGAYDRTLPRTTGTVVALLHDGELVESLPEQPHDVRVDAAVTPREGLVRLGRG
jgi:5-formyltetrahydrofolate cyclo-ligase